MSKEASGTKFVTFELAELTMASTNVINDFFRAVSVGSLDDLNEILGKTERKMVSNLAESYNEMGETPLLVAINKRHLHLVKFLVNILEIDISQVGRFSWKGLNYLNIPPLFAAIISDQIFIIKCLIETRKIAVNLDLFMKDSTTTVLTKINVLKLIGAAYILHRVRDSNISGLSYWKKAEILEQVTVDGDPLNATTVLGAEQKTKGAKNRLNIQKALYVSQQVLKQMRLYPNIYVICNFSKYPWTFIPNYLRSKFRISEELLNVSTMSMYVLKQLNKWWEDDSVSSYVAIETWDVNKEAIKKALADCLSAIRHQKEITPNSTLFPNLMFCFSFASEHLNRIHSKYWPTNQKDRTVALDKMTKKVCHISVSIIRMLPQLSSAESKQFKENLAQFIHLYEEWETDKPHLFHRVCDLSYLLQQQAIQLEFNYEMVIQLFLEAGADPNAIDADGNSPLHCLLLKNKMEFYRYHFRCHMYFYPKENDFLKFIFPNFIASIRVLLNAGSLLDLSNRRGETVLELLKQNRKYHTHYGVPFDPHLESVIDGVLPLTCYCAQSIRKNNIPIVNLPPTLQLLVRRHQTSVQCSEGCV